MKRNMQFAHKYKHSIYSSRAANTLSRKDKKYVEVRNKQIHNIGNTRIIKAPDFLSIYSVDEKYKTFHPFKETLAFKNNLIKTIGSHNCIIDFSNTKSFTAGAMVYLFAQIQSIKNLSKYKIELAWSKESKYVNRIIKRSGLPKLCRTGNPIENLSSVRSLPVVNGVGIQHYAQIMDFIQRRYYKDEMDPEIEFKIGDALSETLNNVGRHAYPGLDNKEKNWWMICDVIGDQLYLCIYDSGVGIPRTVVEKTWFLTSYEKTYPEEYATLKKEVGSVLDKVKLVTLNMFQDHQLIYLSMMGDVSGTKQKKHGQGSKSIKALVSDTNGGKLWVYSNNGLYKYEDGDKSPQVYKLPSEISGTLIQWNIKIG
ncbi:hypothetical protein PSEHALCIP103_03074 [Pseudoalteromonas haloplanktis]|uniref:Uncharacterized protein n=1 Tax=Pseudoalteromonas haloplanktis TaxID=228 RepID=A0A9W4R2W7_PSEHA|nr:MULTISPECIES: hypothetical protein [Pseudoalteromonas]MDC9524031.1 hypothetical protein [Pseudoalteromonas sp. Angola-30]CAH9064176.1 hypothetical protein PSEHALCIP103_03074 [Pseudoalteromonas haloplanktis]